MSALEIPSFEMYYPTEDQMTSGQRKFYSEVEKSLSAGSFIEVGSNISYIFTYLYKVLSKFKKIGTTTVYENLLHISELYSDYPKIKNYCFFWAGECLLAERVYERFLIESETHPSWKGSHLINLRLNLKHMLGWKHGWEIDLINLFGNRSSSFIKRNEAPYHDFLIQKTQEYVQENGGWPVFYNFLSDGQKPYDHYLFGGAPIEKRVMPDPIISLWTKSGQIEKSIKHLCKEAENQAREHLGLPAIGEGWISETTLFKEIKTNFPQTEVIQHGKPVFLGRQHYDIWMPQWKVAIEFHGRQHFEPIEFFGGEEAFQKNLSRDQRKIELSKQHGVHLFVVTHGYDLNSLLNDISSTREDRCFHLEITGQQ